MKTLSQTGLFRCPVELHVRCHFFNTDKETYQNTSVSTTDDRIVGSEGSIVNREGTLNVSTTSNVQASDAVTLRHLATTQANAFKDLQTSQQKLTAEVFKVAGQIVGGSNTTTQAAITGASGLASAGLSST